MGSWRKCGEASSSDVNDGGADIRCDRWKTGNSGKSSFVNFLKEIFEFCWNLSDGMGLVNSAMLLGVRGILMRYFVSRRVTVYVPTRFIPLHIVTWITHVEFLLPWNYINLLSISSLQGL